MVRVNSRSGNRAGQIDERNFVKKSESPWDAAPASCSDNQGPSRPSLRPLEQALRPADGVDADRLAGQEAAEVRPLGVENDTAFKLVNALDERQRAKAILDERPQRDLLLDLIGAWVNIVEPDAPAARMAEIKGKIGETYFAWKGPTAKGSAVYFRVQGATVVIEYAPQGTTDHIHTVVRNPKNDYGAGLLMR
jgi:hypothetical protein